MAESSHKSATTEFTKAQNHIRVYANNANVSGTVYDLTISFGQVVGMKDPETPVVEQSVDVIMSPQHAKALVKLLTQNLEVYETQVGKIPLPETPNGRTSKQRH